MRTGVKALVVGVAACAFSGMALADRPKILLTGYWPPTNEIVRKFSPIPAQNPNWVGNNWEQRGYDIVSYFPEFPGGVCCSWGRGVGDFEIDYQDTAADWARITTQVRPIAIITFSRANTSVGWELEPAYQRFRLPGEVNNTGRSIGTYTPDYSVSPEPRYPTDVPIASEPLGTLRNSSLPMQQIVSAVDAAFVSSVVDPFIATYSGNPAAPNGYDFAGGFLSGYIAYLGAWYKDTHSTVGSPDRCYAAGHIHVGTSLQVAAGVQAMDITLRTLIAHLDAQVGRCVADVDDGSGTGTVDWGVGIEDLLYYLQLFEAGTLGADVDDGSGTGTRDGGVGIEDLLYFLQRFEGGC